MKKTFKFILAAFAIVTAASCAQEIEDPDALPQEEVELVPMTITVGGEATKTTVGENNAINWCADDEIAVFDNTGTARKFTIVEGTLDGKTARFEGLVAAGSTDFTAVYPFSAAVSVADGAVTVNTPDVQVLDGATIADGATVSVAQFTKDNSEFTFKTAIGYLRVDVKEADVTSIIVKGTNIAGQASFNAAGELQSVAEGKNQVTLTPAGEVFTSGTSYYVTVLPGKYAAEDFSITLVRETELAAELAATKEVTILRNQGFFLDSGKLSYKFVIKDAETLQKFLDNAADYTAKDKAEIVNDIDLTDVTLTPASSFKGVLDGGDYSLKNWTSEAVTLFESMSGTVRNLVIDASCSLSFPATGARFGFIANETAPNSILDNCVNNAPISLDAEKISGVVDENRVIDKQAVSVKAIGALVGVNRGSITNCNNNGNITITVSGNTGNHLHLGGIAGYADLTEQIAAGGSEIAYDNCINAGDITYTVSGKTSYAFIGGVTGGTDVASVTSDYNGYRGLLKNSKNIGNISYSFMNGGTLDENQGKAGNANYTRIGGVVGYWEGDVTGCVNGEENTTKGKVSFQVPTLETSAAASTPSLGGVAGYIMHNVTGCINYAPLYVKGTFAGGTQANPGSGVKADIHAGGVVAMVGPYSSEALKSTLVSDCHNYGPLEFYLWMAYVNGTEGDAGGVVGYCSAKMQNCSNAGQMTVESKCAATRVAGVVGRSRGDISNVRNTGALYFTSNRTTAGPVKEVEGSVGQADLRKQCMGKQKYAGVVAYAEAGVNSAFNEGTLTVDVKSADLLSGQLVVGGVIARMTTGSALTTIANSKAVTVTHASSSTGAVIAGAAAWVNSAVASAASNTAAVTYNCNEQKSTVWFGGGIGYTGAATMTGVSNSGSLTINGDYATTLVLGGLVGELTAATKVEGTNTSAIMCNTGGNISYIGGVLGKLNVAATVKAVNDGTIDATKIADRPYFAGIAGNIVQASTFDHCKNLKPIHVNTTATISQPFYLAGILSFADLSSTFDGCENSGDLTFTATESSATGNSYIAGISNSSGKKVYYNECKNTGNLKIDCKVKVARIGGIAGYNTGSGGYFRNCESKCDIAVKKAVSSGADIGGIAGYCNPCEFTNNIFEGNITVLNNCDVGGILGAGNNNNNTVMNGSRVKAVIAGTGTYNSGLLIGYLYSGAYTLSTDANPCKIVSGCKIGDEPIGEGNMNDYLVGALNTATVTASTVYVAE